MQWCRRMTPICWHVYINHWVLFCYKRIVTATAFMLTVWLHIKQTITASSTTEHHTGVFTKNENTTKIYILVFPCFTWSSTAVQDLDVYILVPYNKNEFLPLWNYKILKNSFHRNDMKCKNNRQYNES